MRIRVKVCGITNLRDAEEAVRNGADALGFVFYKHSPRKVSVETAKKIIERIPPFIERVGVFVNEKKQRVKDIIKSCGLTAVQFHGDETPGYCSSFKDIKVIKAIRVKDKKSLKIISAFNKADAILLDTFDEKRFGGTGRSFDWRLIKRSVKNRPIILAGGLTPDNVAIAIKKVQPYAVDVSSGIESRPGKKDHSLMKAFFAIQNGIADFM